MKRVQKAESGKTKMPFFGKLNPIVFPQPVVSDTWCLYDSAKANLPYLRYVTITFLIIIAITIIIILHCELTIAILSTCYLKLWGVCIIFWVNLSPFSQ